MSDTFSKPEGQKLSILPYDYVKENNIFGIKNDGEIKIYSTSDFNLKSPIENGKTFEENSIIKSKYFSKKTGLICLADDSGLEIDALNKAPGIYSSRWGGKNLDFKKAIKRVYRELEKKIKIGETKKLKQGLYVLFLSVILTKKLLASVVR